MSIQNIAKEPTPLDKAVDACRLVFIYSLVFGFAINILMLATPIYSMQVLDRVLSSQSKETLVMLTIVIIIALLALAFVQGARSFVMLKMGHWLDKQLAPVIFAHTIKSSAEKKTIGASQNLRDLTTFKSFITSPSFVTIIDCPWALIFLIVLFILHPLLGILALLGGISLVILAIINEYSTKPVLEKTQEHYIKSLQLTEQATRNAEVIGVMGLLPVITRNWQKTNRTLYHLQDVAGSRGAIIGEITKFMRLFLQISVTGVGAYLCIKGELTSGGIIAASTLVSRALSPLEASIASWKNFVQARKAYDNLKKIFENHSQESSSLDMPVPKGLAEVENAYYSPGPNQKPIIKGIQCIIEPGDVVAVIGNSGSGKTTLAKMLVGAVKPTLGVVRLDGVDVYQWRSEDKGQYIGYVPQGIELFSGTVKENIARMDDEAPDEAIIAAAQMTEVHDAILRLPKGYDTEIGLEGSMLSGGQRQRIALARAFYGNPRFVVLDEPNSNLDYEGEAALSRTILRAKEEKITTVIISHRMTLMSVVDKVLVIKEGLIAAYGPRDQVMSQMGGAAGTPPKPDTTTPSLSPSPVSDGTSKSTGFKREKKAPSNAGLSFQLKSSDSTTKPSDNEDPA